MAKKQPTYEEIRQELIREIEMLDQYAQVGQMRMFIDKAVEIAVAKFDRAVKTKQRHIELGELAENFFGKVIKHDR